MTKSQFSNSKWFGFAHHPERIEGQYLYFQCSNNKTFLNLEFSALNLFGYWYMVIDNYLEIRAIRNF